MLEITIINVVCFYILLILTDLIITVKIGVSIISYVRSIKMCKVVSLIINKKLIYLFTAFFRIGILGYGGGPSFIPLIYIEIVRRYCWMTDDEFNNVLAIGNTLPGPIATKIAGFVGWKLAGFGGMLVSLSALVLPTALAVIILLTSMAALQDLPWVQGMRKSVPSVIGVMLGLVVYQFMDKSTKELGWLKSFFIFIISLIMIGVFNIHPGLIIFVIVAVALLWPVGNYEGEGREN